MTARDIDTTKSYRGHTISEVDGFRTLYSVDEHDCTPFQCAGVFASIEMAQETVDRCASRDGWPLEFRCAYVEGMNARAPAAGSAVVEPEESIERRVLRELVAAVDELLELLPRNWPSFGARQRAIDAKVAAEALLMSRSTKE